MEKLSKDEEYEKKTKHWLVFPDVMMPHWNVSGYTQNIISDMRKPEKLRRREKPLNLANILTT